MSAATLDGLLDPLSRCLDAESARRVVELRVSPLVRQRIDTLAERANGGVLASDETAEYDALTACARFASDPCSRPLRVRPALPISKLPAPNRVNPLTTSFLNRFSHLHANRTGRVLTW
jgi:hypothetical protein